MEDKTYFVMAVSFALVVPLIFGAFYLYNSFLKDSNTSEMIKGDISSYNYKLND